MGVFKLALFQMFAYAKKFRLKRMHENREVENIHMH